MSEADQALLVVLLRQHLLLEGMLSQETARVAAARPEEVSKELQRPGQTCRQSSEIQRAAETESDGSGFTFAEC
jgi:hypothetical protein